MRQLRLNQLNNKRYYIICTIALISSCILYLACRRQMPKYCGWLPCSLVSSDFGQPQVATQEVETLTFFRKFNP